MNYLATCDRFFGDIPGGAYRIAWEVSNLVARAGHNVTLLCGSAEGDPAPGPTAVNDVTVLRYRFPSRPSLSPLRWLAHVRAARDAVATFLADREWDIIHAHSPVGMLGALAAAPRHRRLIYSVHSPAVAEQWINWGAGGLAGLVKRVVGLPVLYIDERRVLRAADAITAESEYTKGLVARLYGARIASRVRVIPWWWGGCAGGGVDVGLAREELGWPLDRPVVLSVRRMVRRMGLDILLRAVAMIADRHDFTLVLAGDGPERGKLCRLAAELSISDRVIFPGRLSERDLGLAYRAANVSAIPSRALEGFGIIAVEALGRGCPVIASRVGALPEILDPISPSSLVEPTAGAFAAALSSFLKGQLALPSAESLTAYAHQKFSEERVAAAYLSVLSQT